VISSSRESFGAREILVVAVAWSGGHACNAIVSCGAKTLPAGRTDGRSALLACPFPPHIQSVRIYTPCLHPKPPASFLISFPFYLSTSQWISCIIFVLLVVVGYCCYYNFSIERLVGYDDVYIQLNQV